MSPNTRKIRRKLNVIREVLEEVTEEAKALAIELLEAKETQENGREAVTRTGGECRN